MEYNIAIYFLLFIVYSIAGWMLEVTCKSIEAKKFINRGFLIDHIVQFMGVEQ